MVALWMAAALQAVQAAASIGGVVKDGETGLPLPGAAVALQDLGQVVTTDREGRYLITGVPSGPHHVLVRRIGYAPRSFHALVPNHGTLEIVVALRALPVSLQPVEVRSGIPPPTRGLEPGDSTAFPDRSLSLAAVRNHPQLSEPDGLQALGGGAVMIMPESPNGLHVRGGAADQTAYLLDDIPILTPYHAGSSFSAWNPDALARLSLLSGRTSAEFPHTLSAVVAATTRPPGSEFLAQGGVSTTQARLTLSGPIGTGGVGYLVSGRAGFPGLPGRRRDPTYLRGDSQDWLIKLDVPLFAGQLGVLGYGNLNDLVTATDTLGTGQNELEWNGWSAGSSWTRTVGNAAVKLVAWTAGQDAGARWGVPVPDLLSTRRRDVGLAARATWSRPSGSTTGGIRAEWIHTRYHFVVEEDSLRSMRLRAEDPVWAAFAGHNQAIGSRTQLDLGLVGAIASGSLHVAPSLMLEVKPVAAVSVHGGLARRHQFVQSLRNAESIVTNIFPADLFLAAGDVMPVARSDLGYAGLGFRPWVGFRLGIEAYARSFSNVALTQEAGPFVATQVGTGTGTAHGLVLDLAANGARLRAPLAMRILSFFAVIVRTTLPPARRTSLPCRIPDSRASRRAISRCSCAPT